MIGILHGFLLSGKDIDQDEEEDEQEDGEWTEDDVDNAEAAEDVYDIENDEATDADEMKIMRFLRGEETKLDVEVALVNDLTFRNIDTRVIDVILDVVCWEDSDVDQSYVTGDGKDRSRMAFFSIEITSDMNEQQAKARHDREK